MVNVNLQTRPGCKEYARCFSMVRLIDRCESEGTLLRLNIYISYSGFCSRRRADRYIRDGLVIVNGEVGTLQTFVDELDEVIVDSKVIQMKKNLTYLMLNKPRDIICTAAKNVPENIIDFIDYPERIFPVGRLDKHSEGLLILTNDGPIVNELLKKESLVEKDYIVTVNRVITPQFISDLSNGVSIYNPRVNGYTVTNACIVKQLNDSQLKITLTQGLNRQIRRMCRRYQYTVTNLKRIRLKELHLGDLPIGDWRYLTSEEIADLKS